MLTAHALRRRKYKTSKQSSLSSATKGCKPSRKQLPARLRLCLLFTPSEIRTLTPNPNSFWDQLHQVTPAQPQLQHLAWARPLLAFSSACPGVRARCHHWHQSWATKTASRLPKPQAHLPSRAIQLLNTPHCLKCCFKSFENFALLLCKQKKTLKSSKKNISLLLVNNILLNSRVCFYPT